MGCGSSVSDQFTSAILLECSPSKVWNLLTIERVDPTLALHTHNTIQNNGSGRSNEIIPFHKMSPLLAAVVVTQVTLEHRSVPRDNRRVEIVKMLLNEGAKVNDTFNDAIMTPLLMAVINFFPKCVKVLVDKQADPYSMNNFGDFPLGFICKAHREPQRPYLTNEEQTQALIEMSEAIISPEVVAEINSSILGLTTFLDEQLAFNLFLSSITVNDDHLVSAASLSLGPVLSHTAKHLLKAGLNIEPYAELLSGTHLWREIQQYSSPLLSSSTNSGSFSKSQRGFGRINDHNNNNSSLSSSLSSAMKKEDFVRLVVESAMSLVTRESGALTNSSTLMTRSSQLALDLSHHHEALSFHLQSELNNISSFAMENIQHVKGSVIELIRRKLAEFIIPVNHCNPDGVTNNTSGFILAAESSKKNFALGVRRDVDEFSHRFNARVHQTNTSSNVMAMEQIGREVLESLNLN